MRNIAIHILMTSVALLLTASATHAQTTWHVDDDAPADPGPGDPTVSDPAEDGSPDHPFDAIQEAIDAATDGDTVLVADGTYIGPGNKNLDYAGKPITVRSQDGPEACIIDCENDGRGFYFHSGETEASVVDGLTIINGYVESAGGGILCTNASPTITGCIVTGCSAFDGGGITCSQDTTISDCVFFENAASLGFGGGVLCFGNATVSNCDIRNNTALEGGGIGCDDEATIADCTVAGNLAYEGGGGIAGDDNPTVTGCTIFENTAGFGGGIKCESGEPTIEDCLIADNVAVEPDVFGGGGGGIIFCGGTIARCQIVGNTVINADWDEGGGGIYSRSCPGTIIDCEIVGNVVDGIGGGVLAWPMPDDDLIIANCVIAQNVADWKGGGCRVRRTARLVNCAINQNQAPLGGGVHVESGYPRIINCSVTHNQADRGGGLYSEKGFAKVFNCVLWANEAVFGPQIAVYLVEPTVSYCNAQGGLAAVWLDDSASLIWGPGNIDADPLFVDPGESDYRLGPGSPCIDAGDNTAVPDWLLTDLDDNPRFWDDRHTADTGNPDGIHPIVDMGAYEFGSEGCPDDNGDGFVTICHIPPGHPERARTITVPVQAAAAHLAHGDYCGPCNEGSEGDLNHNGDVDLSDLAELLAQYGDGCN